MNHPSAEEWMAYLYNETAPARKREMRAHLKQCGDCGGQLNRWRAGMVVLDQWELPKPQPARSAWQPVLMLKWAAAAAIVLAAGFLIGRQTSSVASETAALKASVAQLAGKIESARAFNMSNAVAAASSSASEQTIRLLSEYARLDDECREEDRQKVRLALRELDSRLANLRAELETVAVNTETGFRQTKEGLTTLASYAVADRAGAPDSPDSERINH